MFESKVKDGEKENAFLWNLTHEYLEKVTYMKSNASLKHATHNYYNFISY